MSSLSKKNPKFWVREITLLDSTSPNLLRQKIPRTATREQSKSNPKNNERARFVCKLDPNLPSRTSSDKNDWGQGDPEAVKSNQTKQRKNLNFGLDRKPTHSVPKPPQTKNGQRTPGRTTKSNSKSNPKKCERGFATFLRKINFGLDKTLLDSSPTSSDKKLDSRTPRGHDRRATFKIKPKNNGLTFKP
jgi:hypothetical protein